MADKAKKRKRQRRQEFKYQDFRVILDLPERLAEPLRLLLHLDKATWNFALDKIRQGKAYREWSKSKGKGKGRRYFAAPCADLKMVQRAILNRVLLAIGVHFARHGGQRGSSILTNVGHHVGFAKSVFSIDIVHAFPTVFRSRIKANLKKPFYFQLRQFGDEAFDEKDKKQMLEALVDLMALHDRLPQGPPTSPRILDIVCAKMDRDIWTLLSRSGTPFQSYRFTAYADDLTISSDGEIPEELRLQVLKIIRANGFIPHTREDKTKYFSPETGEVPVVTGVVINRDGRLTMAPRKVNQLRARLHRFNGLKTWDQKTRGEVAGTIGYIRQLYPKRVPAKLKTEVEAAETRLTADLAHKRGLRIPLSKVGPTTSESASGKPKKRPRRKLAKKSGKGKPADVSDIAVATK